MINSFLLIGQSNMVGRGKRADVAEILDEKICVFRNGEWMPAREPYHEDNKEDECGLGASFAKTLTDRYQKIVGLIPCAVGGTKLEQWQPGEKLYENAVRDTQAALKNSTLKGVLWHQGENDSDTEDRASRYEERFYSFMPKLLEQIGGQDVPLIIGELGEFLKDNSFCYLYPKVIEALHRIADREPNAAIVSSRGLAGQDDHVHFSAASLRTFGVRYAETWIAQADMMGIALE